MSQSVVFRTPGTLDLRAITVFGINAKPNSTNPIGFFGTGLKYAIAVLLREGAEVILKTNGRVYTFTTEVDDFREKEFKFIVMKTRARPKTRLPFTTETGKTWKLWQAFRELYSNTLDENGEVYLHDRNQELARPGNDTLIIVTGAGFENELGDIDKNFLADGIRIQDNHDLPVQIIDRPSNHIYYRGMRVQDLRKPSRLTYNLLAHVELTEDRTLKYDWWATQHILLTLVKTDQAPAIEKALTAEPETYEAGLDFKDFGYTPGETFNLVSRMLREKNELRNFSSYGYIQDHDPTYRATQAQRHFTERLADLMDRDEWDKFRDLAREVQDPLKAILRAYQPRDTENSDGAQVETSGFIQDFPDEPPNQFEINDNHLEIDEGDIEGDPDLAGGRVMGEA